MTHEEKFAQQYKHKLCGKKVETETGHVFTIYRVVNSRFGQLAMSKEDQNSAYQVTKLTILSDKLCPPSNSPLSY